MNRKLFWKLSLCLTLGSILLVWMVSTLSLNIERHFSRISAEHKAELTAYKQQAEALMKAGDLAALSQWVNKLSAREGVYVNIIRIHWPLKGLPM